jgi:UTP-glucose-1-phosphate uridylyltransferase
MARQRTLYGYEFTGHRYDTSDTASLVQATIAFALKRPTVAEQLRDYLRKLEL